MKIINFLLITLILVTATGALAELHDRGGGLIYDDILNVTWLQDANCANTTGYDDTLYGFDTGGLMTWDNAMLWADGLSYYDSVRNVIWDDWRLPRTLPVNGLNYDYHINNDGSTDRGYNISALDSVYPGSTASEMAYMYYNNLSNKGRYDVTGNPQPDWGLQNISPFYNLQADGYWSSVEYYFDPDWDAWGFYFDMGNQNQIWKLNRNGFAWAVRDGDVGLGPTEVKMDIIPKTCPNECPLKGGGSVEVAILGTVDLDVNDIDIASIRLQGLTCPPKTDPDFKLEIW